MAAAGGHWTKAAGGPYAGKAVFVPALKKINPGDIGNGMAAVAFEDAYSQGQLMVFYTPQMKWFVASKPPDSGVYFVSSTKEAALTKMQNMNAKGMGKALAEGDADKTKAWSVTNSSSFSAKEAPYQPPKPAATTAATATATAANVTGFKDVRDVYGDIYTANDAFAAHFDVAKAKYTANQIDAVSQYQDGKFDYINAMLWQGKELYYSQATVKGWIKDIDGAMKKSPGLPHDTLLYRFKQSSSSLAKWAEKAKIGTPYKPKGFDSTSANSQFDKTAKVTLRYHAPKGVKGFYMNANGYSSSHPHEYEYLLPRNLKWQVSGKHVNEAGRITIDLELVSGGF